MCLTRVILRENDPIPYAFELNSSDNPVKLNQSKRLVKDYFI